MIGSEEQIARPEESLVRFNRRIQVSRFAVFAIAYPLSLLLLPTDVLALGFLDATMILVASTASALVFYSIASTPLGRRLGTRLAFLSFAFDGLMITILVHLDGGLSSIFFIWYIANTAAATFSGGHRATYLMMALNAFLYLSLLLATGEISLVDGRFLKAGGQLAFLFGASYFAFHGIAESREKHMVVKKLQEEEKLKVEALTRLTEELDEQSRELADANVQIQQANRLKSQFLATMSHELRTPLNSVIGFANILESSLPDRATEKELKFLRNILRSGEHLLSLINDLLDLSKIEAGRMEVIPEAIDVMHVLRGVHDVMKG
ncbi:MAG: histidine kinase dimerization/phospho-acceptor domain-containing protein, partial [Thermoanaerobaculia bacterium]|nr:histidine kinase dimerization/phospho-acceptor domain-containing protein [Thermoanaerobaculia bacterium]